MRATTMLVLGLSLAGTAATAATGEPGTRRRVVVTCCVEVGAPLVPAPVCAPINFRVPRRVGRQICRLMGARRIAAGGTCEGACAPSAGT